ncbi:MAG: segregation/condensation protein A [Anaerolineae bacterium]
MIRLLVYLDLCYNLRAVDSYSIHLPDFEGPLDLLLQLIERQEMDISRVSLAAVADQYLEFVTRPGNIELNSLADYLVIAAKLILAKSRMLLPQENDATGAETEDSADALARQLREYKLFKQTATLLRQREQQGLHSYPRRVPPARPTVPKAARVEGLSFDALYQALRHHIEANPPLPTGTLIEPLRISIYHRMENIRELTRQALRVRFTALLQDARSRVEIIVIFLAVLESIKRRYINAQQDELFGEIFLIRRDETALPAILLDDQDESEFAGA